MSRHDTGNTLTCPGVDLLRARYVRHAFSRHAHDRYAIAAVTAGVEGAGLPGRAERAGGSVVLTPVALVRRAPAAARLGFTVTGASLYTVWNLTTLLGALGASALGDPDAWGLDAAGPAVFLALLAPMVKGRTERAAAVLAVLLALACLPVLPAGVPVLVAALAAPLALAASRRPRRPRPTHTGPYRERTRPRRRRPRQRTPKQRDPVCGKSRPMTQTGTWIAIGAPLSAATR